MEFFKTDNLSLDTQSELGAVLSINVLGRSVNVFTRQLLGEINEALDRLAELSGVQLLTIRSGKPSGFMAGADLHEFTTIRSADEAMALSATGQRLFDKLADLPIPTLAVIQGPCLGGGLEFALACDYRLVIDHAKTQLGLPELMLGLLPGWGGTQRLPRVVGLEQGLQLILRSRHLNALEAWRWGLADAVAQEHDLAPALGRLAEQALRRGKRPKKGFPLRTWRQRLLESNPLGRRLLFAGTERILRRQVPDDMPAPWEAFQAVRAGATRGMVAGLEYERQAIGRLALTRAGRNLVTLFFLNEKARKPLTPSPSLQRGEGRDSQEGVESTIRRVGVVGAGTMGAGIAQLAAVKGFEVVVQEVSEAALAAGMQRIEGLFQRAVERRVLSQDEARRKVTAIGRTTAWEGFGDVDLVIEAVLEELDKKREVFRELARRTRPTTILTTNTSSLRVGDLQEALEQPERVAGLHFFNPVHRMPLVEVVRAPQTADSVLATLTQWTAAVGKTPVAVKDSPGFIVNRILTPYLNEAGMLVAGGMPIERVDRIMRRFGMLMGPLELLDLVGLDVAAHIARAMKPVFGDRLTPHPALEQMCEWGWLGQKTGVGFYRHKGKTKKPNTEAMVKLRDSLPSSGRAGSGADTPLAADMPPPEEARERLVTLMVNEAATCLGEGLAERADVIDLAMVLGTGWAPHRGGPLRYADDCGPADLVRALVEFSKRIGPRFAPCPELRRRAEAGEPFYSSLPALQPA